MAILAARRNDPALCERIPADFRFSRRICRRWFARTTLHHTFHRDIPQQMYFNILLAGQGNGHFRDVSTAKGVGKGEWAWNGRFIDADGDGYQDIFTVNGSFHTHQFTPNVFFTNLGGKRFRKDISRSGLGDRDHSSAFVVLDFDQDGDPDLITNTIYGPLKFWRNNSRSRRITVELEDRSGMKSCLGCSMQIFHGGDGQQMRRVEAGGGFRSFDSPVLHFGLGGDLRVSRWQVRCRIASASLRMSLPRSLSGGISKVITLMR